MITNFDNPDFWLKQLLSNSKEIEKYVEVAKAEDRLKGSQEILNILRHTLESSICYVALREGYKCLDPSKRQNVNEGALHYMTSQRNKYEVFCSLHDSINKSYSHESSFIGDYAERMMLSYFPRLMRVQKWYLDKYQIHLFKNLKQFPLNIDRSLKQYYSAIVNALINSDSYGKVLNTEMYYFLDKKEKYIDDTLFFEYTLSIVDDSKNKADKIIAFSKIDIFSKYAMKIQSYDENINILGVNTSVKIITSYDITIRNCEFEKLGLILGIDAKNFSKTKEYFNLMKYIKDHRQTMADIIRYNRKRFDYFVKSVLENRRVTILKSLLIRAWEIIHSKNKGKNVLLYLLASMENETIGRQMAVDGQKTLNFTNLHLSSKVSPFDNTPFCADLVGTNVDGDILFSTFDVTEHECELVKRQMDEYCKTNSLIYCPDSIFDKSYDLVSSIQELNRKNNYYGPFVIDFAYDKFNNRYIYLKKNEEIIVELFKKIFGYIETETIADYKSFCTNKIEKDNIIIDDPLKREAIEKMFDKHSLFAVYGPAGTGKSYFARLALDVLDTYKTLCISSTHASLENIKRRIGPNKAVYATVEKVVKNKSGFYKKYDLVIIDECSTISNSDMLSVLNNINAKLVLLMGDVYQIQSIDLGNWFALLEKLTNDENVVYLDKCHRTGETVLKDFWELVRDIKPNIHEYMKNYEISKGLNKDFFNATNSDDRVILCLNYSGLYGINNINRLMQCKHEGKEVSFRQHIYKIGDPVLFNDNHYYEGIFYNNLKGTITNIVEFEDKITFTILAKDNLNIQINQNKVYGVKHIEGNTMVTFDVFRTSDNDLDEDMKPNYVVPFNVAYSISIHKAQGLEFEEVDVVISSDIKEIVTHNIFYTAVTRAIKNLNIYWSPECENTVISNMQTKNYTNDEKMLLKKYQFLRAFK